MCTSKSVTNTPCEAESWFRRLQLQSHASVSFRVIIIDPTQLQYGSYATLRKVQVSATKARLQDEAHLSLSTVKILHVQRTRFVVDPHRKYIAPNNKTRCVCRLVHDAKRCGREGLVCCKPKAAHWTANIFVTSKWNRFLKRRGESIPLDLEELVVAVEKEAKR